MTKFVSFAVVGATIFAAAGPSRESAARISVAADDPAPSALRVTVTGRVTLLTPDARAARTVSAAVVSLEPLAPPPVPASMPPSDAAPRATPPAAPAAPRDTVRALWDAVRELRQTVAELRETLRQLRAPGSARSTDVVRAEAARADSARALRRADSVTAARSAAPPPRTIPGASIVMRDKEFLPHVQVVEVGGAVDFPNRDPFSHNVFSTTSGGAFDLGLYPKGESRGATFRRPGTYAIFCNIHAKMSAFVVAVPTRWHARPAADGRFTIADVPPGRYRMRVWHERAPEQTSIVTVGERGAGDVAVTLDARAYRQSAHLNKFGQAYPTAGRDDY